MDRDQKAGAELAGDGGALLQRQAAVVLAGHGDPHPATLGQQVAKLARERQREVLFGDLAETPGAPGSRPPWPGSISTIGRPGALASPLARRRPRCRAKRRSGRLAVSPNRLSSFGRLAGGATAAQAIDAQQDSAAKPVILPPLPVPRSCPLYPPPPPAAARHRNESLAPEVSRLLRRRDAGANRNIALAGHSAGPPRPPMDAAFAG